MNEKNTAIGTIIAILFIAICAAVYGWATLPEHQAKADTSAVMIPYQQQQAAINTDALYAETEMRLARAAKVQPYKTAAGITVFLLAIGVMAATGSYAAIYSYQSGQRVARQMSLPVAQEVGTNFVLFGDGKTAVLLNTATSRVVTALTAVEGDETFTALMEKVLVTRELAAGAEAVARHSKDGAVGDYLMGQVENITSEVNG